MVLLRDVWPCSARPDGRDRRREEDPWGVTVGMRRLVGDIMSDVAWSIELEPEVEAWLESLPIASFATVVPHIERLALRGSGSRMPASRSLGDGLFELRFDLDRVAWRISYHFADRRRIVLMTVFRKQRMNESAAVARARAVMARCIADGHTAEED